MENQEKVNILLVDDTPANLLSRKSILDELGENIVCVSSGEEALKYLLREDFAVILMDVNMPGLNGFETAALIRQRPRSAHTPIIFVTATGTTEMERAKGYLFGAVDYIYSPVVPEILQAKVAAFCDLFRMSQAFKQQAEELTILDEKLEEQIIEGKRLNQQLELANKKLEITNHELTSFSYSVSHDLRNVLSGIIGYSEILRDEYADKLDEAGKDYIQVLYSTAWRMNELIEALLKLSRLSQQEMKHEPIDLTAMVKTIAIELKKTEQKRQVQFVIKKNVLVNGDSSLLQIALQNLLSNAWKYSSKQPEALIEFGVLSLKATDRRMILDRKKIPSIGRRYLQERDSTVYFIRDNGAGFDMSQADKLFRAFNRLHTDDEFKGIGIGLTIVQ
ncbi:MAG: response regulator, partial [Candidatus Desantisbacteria bacterium]